MSHIAVIQLDVTDLPSLARAAQICGLEFVPGQTEYKWFGRWVGDSPLPEGIDIADLGKCSHAIRVPNNDTAYEIGVVAKPGGGYTLLWDFWAGGKGLEALAGTACVNLRTEYAAARSTHAARSKRYRVTRTDTAELLTVTVHVP
jgi:hypothetical protein